MFPQIVRSCYDFDRTFIEHLPNYRQIPPSVMFNRPTALSYDAFRSPAKTIQMTIKASALPLRRILLAEDDESMCGFLMRALEKAGYDVAAFNNGADALERLQQEPFSLLLTDIVMPRMDGIELARRASELDPELKIMFITGFAAVTLNNETQTPKDARVLSKPFHLKDLVREVDKLLS
jgi:two-component system, cell cycle response regulator CpdR